MTNRGEVNEIFSLRERFTVSRIFKNWGCYNHHRHRSTRKFIKGMIENNHYIYIHIICEQPDK